LLVSATILLAVLTFAHERVRRVGGASVVALDQAPPAAAAVVLGARILPDGTPYHMLVDRLEAGRRLFTEGRVPEIVVSGRGGGSVAEDEVLSMRRWLEQRGVPPTAIVDDPLGLRTIDTVRRARERYGSARVLLVSNPFHAARCVYLAESVGLRAVGIQAPPGHLYSFGTRARNHAREVAARVLAWFEMLAEGNW
jgi:SanA protein